MSKSCSCLSKRLASIIGHPIAYINDKKDCFISYFEA